MRARTSGIAVPRTFALSTDAVAVMIGARPVPVRRASTERKPRNGTSLWSTDSALPTSNRVIWSRRSAGPSEGRRPSA